jgi:hypothetical protein
MNGTTADHLIEVRVYQYGLLRVCEWCTSLDDAAGVVEMWKALGGVRCEIVGRPD